MTFASVGGGEAGKENWNLVRYELRGADRLSIYLDNRRFWTDAVRNKLVSGEQRKVVLAYGSVIFEDNAACEFTRQ
jgi:hypothetical protein